MIYNFCAESERHARAALLLYAMYRSRSDSSSLTGKETWERFHSYMRAACIKAENTAEFVEHFCRKAQIGSIKPAYLTTDMPQIRLESGALISMKDARDYALDAFTDDILSLYNSEAHYLIMLVRERLQREKLGLQGGIEDGE